MPFTAERIGTAVGALGNEFRIADSLLSQKAVYLMRRAGTMTHSLWELLPDGGLAETTLQTKPAGQDLALALYDSHHLMSIHRPGLGKLVAELYTGGVTLTLEESTSLEFENDARPQIVMFGQPPSADPAALEKSGPPALQKPQPSPVKKQPDTAAGGRVSGPAVIDKLKRKKPVTPGVFKGTVTAKVGRAIVGTLTEPENGNLRLTAWSFGAGGEVGVIFGYGPKTLAGPAKSFSLAKVRDNWVNGKLLGVDIAAALVNPNNKLVVQLWRLSYGSPSTFAKVGEVVAPESVSRVSCCAVTAFGGPRIVTAVQMQGGSGLMKVIGWRLDAAGAITRIGESTGAGITAVAAAPVRGNIFVTATRESDERFKATYWRFPATEGQPLEAIATAAEGKIENALQCAHVPGQGSNIGDTIFATRDLDKPGVRLWRYRITET